MTRNDYDDYADLFKFAQCAVITWALAALMCFCAWGAVTLYGAAWAFIDRWTLNPWGLP